LYGVDSLEFGVDYVIPKPLDPRVLEWETPAVAQAAMDSGVATVPVADMKAYAASLRVRVDAAARRAAAVVDSYSGV
jgi:malate dehydrogenase (oxaloacetate-decarboxylating)(NADP+)